VGGEVDDDIEASDDAMKQCCGTPTGWRWRGQAFWDRTRAVLEGRVLAGVDPSGIDRRTATDDASSGPHLLQPQARSPLTLDAGAGTSRAMHRSAEAPLEASTPTITTSASKAITTTPATTSFMAWS
jgi:hypothetical protein